MALPVMPIPGDGEESNLPQKDSIFHEKDENYSNFSSDELPDILPEIEPETKTTNNTVDSDEEELDRLLGLLDDETEDDLTDNTETSESLTEDKEAITPLFINDSNLDDESTSNEEDNVELESSEDNEVKDEDDSDDLLSLLVSDDDSSQDTIVTIDDDANDYSTEEDEESKNNFEEEEDEEDDDFSSILSQLEAFGKEQDSDSKADDSADDADWDSIANALNEEEDSNSFTLDLDDDSELPEVEDVDNAESEVNELLDLLNSSENDEDPHEEIADSETESDEDEEEEEDVFDEDFEEPSNPFATLPKIEDTEVDEEDDFTVDNPSASDEDLNSDDLEVEDKELNKPAKKRKKDFKKFFANYLATVKAELNGKSAPELKDDDLEDDADRPEESRGKGRKKARLSLGFITKPYLMIVKVFFKLLTFILKILSMIPLIGKLVNPVLAATKILERIALTLPIVFVIGGLILTSYLSVPRESSIELPDSGGAVFSEFEYSKDTNEVSGKITNTGNIVATVIPEFSLRSIKPTINPKSWVVPSERLSCKSDYVSVDIDAVKEVKIKCGKSSEIEGFIPRATGILSE